MIKMDVLDYQHDFYEMVQPFLFKIINDELKTDLQKQLDTWFFELMNEGIQLTFNDDKVEGLTVKANENGIYIIPLVV